MGALHAGHHHRDVRHLQQRQIVGGIAQGQHLHLWAAHALLQRRERIALAHLRAQQMTHAIAPHNRQPHRRHQRIQTRFNIRGRRHERNTPAAALGLPQRLTGQTEQPLPLSIRERIQGLEGCTEVQLQLLQLRLQLRPSRAQRLLPRVPCCCFTVNRTAVFDDVGIAQLRRDPKPVHLFRGLAGAGNHGDAPTLQPAQGGLRWRPVVAVIHQGSIQIGHHPPGGAQPFCHDGINQWTA